MSVERQRFIAYAEAVVRQYNEVNALITSGLANEIPQEVGIELQHMLMHLVAAEKQVGCDYSSKTHELANALAHVDRAFLDGCKILVHKKFSLLQKTLPSMQEWVATRLSERQSHSRGMSPDSNRDLMPPQTNPLCDRFKKLLVCQGLLPVSWVGPGTMPAPGTKETWTRWKDFFPNVECWLRLDLFYSALRNQKHHGALRTMLLCFMDLDSERLARQNLQLMLDTLVSCGDQAAQFGWPEFAELKCHFSPFIKDYMGTSGEQDVTAEQDWIYSLFKALWKFYMPGEEQPPAWQASPRPPLPPARAARPTNSPCRFGKWRFLHKCMKA